MPNIHVGEQVLSRNEHTGQLSFQQVLNQYNNPYKQTVYIDIKDAAGNTQTIVSNKIHPFFTKVNHDYPLPPSSEGHDYQGDIENAQWVDASNLKAGYQLLSENGEWQVVQNVRQTNEPLSAYNLTVNNDHTYFVTGSDSTYGVWVHNACGDIGKGVVATRVNVRNGDANVAGSGLEYAWKKHGGNWGSHKSSFTISKSELKDLLQDSKIVSSPAIESSSGNFIRIVDVGRTIGLDATDQNLPTSIITVITDSQGNLVNTFPGRTIIR